MSKLHQVLEAKYAQMKRNNELTEALQDAGRLQDKLRMASYRKWFLAEHAELGLRSKDLSIQIDYPNGVDTCLRCKYIVQPGSQVYWTAHWRDGTTFWKVHAYRVGSHCFLTFLDAAFVAYKPEKARHVG